MDIDGIRSDGLRVKKRRVRTVVIGREGSFSRSVEWSPCSGSGGGVIGLFKIELDGYLDVVVFGC